MQILLHAGVHFACVFFTYTHALSQGCLWSHMLLHRYFYTGTPLHREMPFFTHKCFYREMILHWAIWHRNQNKQRCFYKGMHVHEGFFSYGHFHTDILQNYFLWRTRVWRKEFSKHMQNHSLTTAFDGRDAFSVKRVGPEQTHIAIWPQCMTIDISCERVAFRGRQSTPPCRSKRKLETIKVVGVCKKLISTCVFTSATPHLHISTSRFQKTISAGIYKSCTTPADGIYSFGSCVKEGSVNLRFWICFYWRPSVRFMLASTPVYINLIL